MRLDGQEFVLGTFTHNNFPIQINRTSFTVKLAVNVAFDEGSLNRNFNFSFNHLETPNRGSARQQADRVILSSMQSTETITIDGEDYAVEIVGFKQNGEVVHEFLSFENAANSAVIVAKLVLIPKPEPEPELELEVSTTCTFNVLNPDGSVFGKGCFSYRGNETPVDLAHIMGGSGNGSKLASFWYHDPLVGTMSMEQLLSMNFVHDAQGKPSRFTINAANVPQDTHALAGGIATPEHAGAVSIHRNDSENMSCACRTITFPTPCYHPAEIEGETEGETPVVDLVVVIDTSASMKSEATNLSETISAAIESAKTKCPSDLKVTYLGIEGRFRDSLFDTTIREHLTGLGVAESDMRGRKRGTVAEGGAQEDGARAIEDVSRHHNWRDDAIRAIFYLSDEGLEGGDTASKIDSEDIDAATLAIDVATSADVRVHTYMADSSVSTKAKRKLRQDNEAEFARVASGTGGQFFSAQDMQGNSFQQMLEQVICTSKVPVGADTSKPCPCTREAIESASE